MGTLHFQRRERLGSVVGCQGLVDAAASLRLAVMAGARIALRRLSGGDPVLGASWLWAALADGWWQRFGVCAAGSTEPNVGAGGGDKVAFLLVELRRLRQCADGVGVRACSRLTSASVRSASAWRLRKSVLPAMRTASRAIRSAVLSRPFQASAFAWAQRHWTWAPRSSASACRRASIGDR